MNGPSPRHTMTGPTGDAGARTGGDACPGALRPHPASDGSLIRLRVPGGKIRVDVLQELVLLAGRHGSPLLQLTSRANVQLRGLPDPLPTSLVQDIESLGLLPSLTHEHARGILAVPTPAAQELALGLDAAVRAEPALAALPGRFLTVVSDSSALLLAERWDLALQLQDKGRAPAARGDVRVLVAGDLALPEPMPPQQGVAEAVRLMRVFLQVRPDERVWNVRDLPHPTALDPDLVPAPVRPAPPLRAGDRPGPGQLVAGVPLGLLRPEHIGALAQVSGPAGHVYLTPWRALVVDATHTQDQRAATPDTTHGTLARAGLVVDASSPWERLSACVGAPHCARTTSPTLALAAEAATRIPTTGPRVHVVGCVRACGRPPGRHLLVISPTHPDQIVQEAR